MIYLYDIKNYEDVEPIPLYAKDTDTFVLKGNLEEVELKFNTPGYKAGIIDYIAHLMFMIDKNLI